jgi:hypothetical protein
MIYPGLGGDFRVWLIDNPVLGLWDHRGDSGLSAGETRGDLGLEAREQGRCLCLQSGHARRYLGLDAGHAGGHLGLDTGHRRSDAGFETWAGGGYPGLDLRYGSVDRVLDAPAAAAACAHPQDDQAEQAHQGNPPAVISHNLHLSLLQNTASFLWFSPPAAKSARQVILSFHELKSAGY